MTTYKVVVDGSNIATEGRTLPSLTQLDEAVQAFIEEHPGADVLVIVDSSFPNRIDNKELAIFEAAYAAGEIITPPAGTIGRGDSFILKVADKLGATVFSNDSFQEFHGTYDWLFDKGRLEGGKPIPGYGWVFTPRNPVRGPKSREAVRESKRSVARIGSPEAMRPMPVPKAPPPFLAKPDAMAVPDSETRGEVRRNERRNAEPAPRAELRIDAEGERKRKKKKRKRKGGNGGGAAEAVVLDLPAVNDPLAFINFISEHLLGSELEGLVGSYSSHGFYVEAAGARCYVPLSGLAEPMPRSAKEVVRKGASYQWVVTAFDSARRGIELALLGTPAALAYAAGGSVPGAAGAESAGGDAATQPEPSKPARSGRGAKSRRSGQDEPETAVAVAATSELATTADKPAKSGKRTKHAKLSRQEVASGTVASGTVDSSANDSAAGAAVVAKVVRGRSGKVKGEPASFDEPASAASPAVRTAKSATRTRPSKSAVSKSAVSKASAPEPKIAVMAPSTKTAKPTAASVKPVPVAKVAKAPADSAEKRIADTGPMVVVTSKAARTKAAPTKAAPTKAASAVRAKAVKAPSAKTVPKARTKAAPTKAVKAPSAKANAPKAETTKVSPAKPGSGRSKTTSAKAKAK